MKTFTAASLALLAGILQAATANTVPFEARQTACSTYTIINSRGTGESQGESAGFRTMNRNVLQARRGGTVYNVVYPAGTNQDSSRATNDIVNQVNRGVASNPNACFILEGYSQGSAGTVNALSRLTGASFAAVKGVFLIGSPYHYRGLTCNVDNRGGTTTRNVDGISASRARQIPSNWLSKTLDVCIFGDGVCDTTNGRGINREHLQYSRDASTQDLGTRFITTVLSGQTFTHA